jgi:Tfp pilus assembly protein PilN
VSVLVNLLPDFRQAKLKERRRRQLVTGVAVVTWAVCGGIILLLTIYVTGQKVAIGVFTNSIKDKTTRLQNINGLTDALTAQQHLAVLPSLYEKRVYMTKFFEAYSAANPADVTLSSMNIDAGNAMIVTGTGKSFAAVAKLDRALEASNVKVGKDASASNEPYFSGVSITSLDNGAKGVNFTVHATLGIGVTSQTTEDTTGTTNGN